MGDGSQSYMHLFIFSFQLFMYKAITSSTLGSTLSTKYEKQDLCQQINFSTLEEIKNKHIYSEI